MKLYITFGQAHAHATPKGTLDKDTVACIEGHDYAHCREIAFNMFNGVFATSYTWDEIKDQMHYFPKGIVDVN